MTKGVTEKLTSILRRRPRAQAVVQPVSQVTMTIAASDLDVLFGDVQREVLSWMQNRTGKSLPKRAWKGESFELAEIGSQPAEATFLKENHYWAARLDDADKSIPDRSWVTEAAIAKGKNNERMLFGARLTCVTRGEEAPFDPTIPGFVRQIVRKFDGIIDDRMVGEYPWIVDSSEKVQKLVELITKPNRHQDVIVISEYGRSHETPSTLVSAKSVSEHVLGAAHVVVITAEASRALTNTIGKELSVFHRAVRTYKFGLDLEEAQPHDHPLAVESRIRSWTGGPQNFQKFLVASCLEETVRRQEREKHLPSYAEVKRIARRIVVETQSSKRIRASTAKPTAELQQENRLYKRQLKEYKVLLESTEKAADELISEAERKLADAVESEKESRSENWRLKARIDHLEKAGDGVQSHAPQIPADFKGLQQWADAHLTGKVRLHRRAVKSAKKSRFENVALAYRALLILRDFYVPMRRGDGGDSRIKYEQALRKENLEETPTFAGTRSGQYGDDYFVSHRGRKRELDHHLKGSDSRDRRFGFRLYFFWDDDDGEVVVGSLPSHLRTNIS